MNKTDTLEDGWFVAVGEQQHGPMSASKAWRLVTSAEAKRLVQVWHPSLPDWRPLSSAPVAAAPGNLLTQKLNLGEFRLTNATYLLWIVCSAAPILILGVALARELQDGLVSIVLVALIGYLGWWFYLEHAGFRVRRNAEIIFPFRLAIWPFPALWLRRIRIAEITGFESWSRGAHAYWFKLHIEGRPVQILLDDPLHREILILALEQRLP